MASNEFSDFIKSIPPFTRYWFCGTIMVSLAARFGLLDTEWLILDSKSIFNDLQLWRPFTALLIFPITPPTALHFLMNLYFLYSYSSRLETGNFITSNNPLDTYGSRRADYAFLLLFEWFWLVILCLVFELNYLMDPMVMAVLYVWCQHNRDVVVQFWFGSSFKAAYLPWVMLLFYLVFSNSYKSNLFGIIVGHAFFFFSHQYPVEFGGAQILKTPAFLHAYFPSNPVTTGFGGPHQFGQRPTRTGDISGTGGYFSSRFPGNGNRLGN